MVSFEEKEEKKTLYKKFINIFVVLKTKKSDFYQRVVVAIILAVSFLFATIVGGFWFNAIMIAASVLSAIEFANMVSFKQQNEKKEDNHLDIIYLKRICIPYLLIPTLSIIFIRECVQGRSIVIWLLLSVWSVDTASYIIGNLFGKNKLYPRISPNKTVEGAVGGILTGLIITVILFPFMCIANGSHTDGFSFYSMIFLSLTVSVLSIIGDLFESYLKRQCGVKDSGSMLLSHGGVMDRTDSIIFAAPIVAILVMLKNGIFF